MTTRLSVFEIKNEIRDIRDKLIDDPTLPDGKAFFDAIKMSGEEKLTQMYFCLQQLEAEAEVGKEAKQVAQNHIDRREAAGSRIKKLMIELACELNMRKFDSPHCRFSVQDGRTTLNIPDINLLDSDYVKTEMIEKQTPLKAEIEKALNKGETVEGAGWKTGDPFIKFLKAKGDN